jgi:hypothetical protein
MRGSVVAKWQGEFKFNRGRVKEFKVEGAGEDKSCRSATIA